MHAKKAPSPYHVKVTVCDHPSLSKRDGSKLSHCLMVEPSLLSRRAQQTRSQALRHIVLKNPLRQQCQRPAKANQPSIRERAALQKRIRAGTHRSARASPSAKRFPSQTSRRPTSPAGLAGQNNNNILIAYGQILQNSRFFSLARAHERLNACILPVTATHSPQCPAASYSYFVR